MVITETSPEILGIPPLAFFKNKNWYDKIFKKGGTSDDLAKEKGFPLTEHTDCRHLHEFNQETSSDENSALLIINNLNEKIDYLERYGIDWNDEDIDVGPNDRVIETLRRTIPKLVKNELVPSRIAPSIDEGACIVFQKERILVYLEFYNDGDVGLISEDIVDNIILENKDLNEDNVINSLKRSLHR